MFGQFAISPYYTMQAHINWLREAKKSDILKTTYPNWEYKYKQEGQRYPKKLRTKFVKKGKSLIL